MLAQQFRVLDKSRQSIATLVALESIHAQQYLLPQHFHRATLSAALTSFSPALLRASLCALLDNAHAHEFPAVDRDRVKDRERDTCIDRESAERNRFSERIIDREREIEMDRGKEHHTLRSLVKYSGNRLCQQAWWQRALVAATESESDGSESDPDRLAVVRRRRLLRSLVSGDLNQQKAVEPTDVELLAEKKLGINISAISRMEELLVAHSNLKGEEENQEGNIAQMFTKFLRTDHSRTKSLVCEIDSLLDSASSIDSIAPRPHEDEGDQYLADLSSQFISKQRQAHRLFTTFPQYLANSSMNSLISEFNVWKKLNAIDLRNGDFANIENLAFTLMSWYTRSHIHHQSFQLADFRSQFLDCEMIIPKFLLTSHSFAHAITGDVKHREEFLAFLDSLIEKLRDIGDSKRRNQLCSDIVAAGMLVSVSPNDWFSLRASTTLLTAMSGRQQDLVEVLLQAVLIEKKGVSVLKNYLESFDSGTQLKFSSSRGTAIVGDLVTRRLSVFAFVKSLSYLRHDRLLVDQHHFDFLFSFMLSSKTNKARSMLMTGLFQPHRIIEAMTIESSWNYENPFPANLLAKLLRLCNKSIHSLSKSSGLDAEHAKHVVAYVQHLVDQWEPSLKEGAMQQLPLIEEILKFHCNSGNIDNAKRLLFFSVSQCKVPSLYEPLIYFHSCVRGDLDEAKLLLNHLLTMDLVPTRRIIDSIVKGYVRNGRYSEALDAAMELFQQHSVQPSAMILEKLVQSARDNGDQHELARINYMRQTMFV